MFHVLRRGKRRAMAFFLSFAMIVTMLPPDSVAYAEANGEEYESGETPSQVVDEPKDATNIPVGNQPVDYSKIDVWDFGAEQLDSSLYNNKLTVDMINDNFPDVAPGTTGVSMGDLTTPDGELRFNGGGKINHRLRSSNANLTRYDDKILTSEDGSITYSGYIYSNSGSNPDVFLEVKLYKNDILTVVVGSNGGSSTINFESPSGKIQQQVFSLGGGKAQVMEFYAGEEGMYKIYSTDEKLVVARVYREHTRPVIVSGNVDAPAELQNYQIAFTNQKTGETTLAAVSGSAIGAVTGGAIDVVSGSAYGITLNENYDYDVALENANGYVITSANTISIPKGAGNQNFDIVVEPVDIVSVYCEIKGLSEDALSKVQLKFLSDRVYVPEFRLLENGQYVLNLERGVTYVIDVSGINDYSLTGSGTIVATENGLKQDLIFEAKATYPVELILSGIDEEAKTNAMIIFSNINEEGYSYGFGLDDEIQLRDGQYSIQVIRTGEYPVVMDITPNVKVEGEATTAVVKFKSLNSWDFATYNGNPGIEIIGGNKYYLGLKLSNAYVSENKTYLLMNYGGSVDVPVKAGDVITVQYCYSAAFQFDDDTTTIVDERSGSTNQMDTVTYTAKKDGYVTIQSIEGSNSTQTYLVSIAVTNPIPYKETITVGSQGCDFTSINDALDAVRDMYRPNNERVTIEIQPGNYEEMLVIDVPNVTLKNASSNPSIELKNKGVDIAEEAVRITSYYGHGYAYYSMDKDCKYNADLLEANKANGSLSFTNPGTGTTSGSYWNATVVVYSSGFEAKDIIFENSFNQYISEKEANDVLVELAGSKEPRPKTVGDTSVQNRSFVERAAALAIADNVSDVYFDQCRFVGRQDTLYGGRNSLVAFNKCKVMGACDFIFGPMTAVFYKCQLVLNTSEDGNDVAYITAAQQNEGVRGYLMYNCTVTSAEPGVETASEKISKPGYFGRPWSPTHSEVVFYKTIINATDFYGELESMIEPIGWLSTLGGTSEKMYEYGTMEALKGADHSAERAEWSTVLTEAKLSDGTDISSAEKAIQAFLGDWLPFTIDPSDDVAEIVEPSPTDPPVQTKTMVLKADEVEAGSYTSTFEHNGFMITAASDRKVDVDTNNKTFDDGESFSQRIKLGGDGAADYRSIHFTTTGAATVKIYALSSSSGSDRALTLFKLDGTEVGDVPAYGQRYEVGTIEIAEAGDYYLASKDSGVNVYGVVVAMEEVPAEPVTIALSADELEVASYDSTFEKNGFTITAASDRKVDVDANSKTFDDGESFSQRIKLGGTGTADYRSIHFTTTGAATVKIYAISSSSGSDRALGLYKLDGTMVGEVPAYGQRYEVGVLEITEAGDYYLASPSSGVNVYGIVVTMEGGSSEPERSDWDTVAAPVITDITQDGSKIIVTFELVTGMNGADKATVSMLDQDGKVIDSVLVGKNDKLTTRTAELVPESSGKYAFQVVAERTDETTVKESELSQLFDFVLPLGTPSIKGATSKGNGSIEVIWDSVKEAEKYVVSYRAEGDSEFKDSITVTEPSALITGLTIGTKYIIAVKAVRGEDVSEADEISATATQDSQRPWFFSAFGQGVNTSTNYYEGNANEGSVTVASEGGKGKLVPASTDGLAFYYTTIDPENENFILEATVNVDSWKYSNGQEGFGLMAADAVGTNGDSSVFWNNSYMATVTKVEYFWDSVNQKVSDAGDKISMKLGVGAQEKTGVTAENIADGTIKNNLTELFKSTMSPLEISCASKGSGTYNIVGNFEAPDPVGTVKEVTTFKLKIQRDNTGYRLSYTDEDGNIMTKLYYDIERDNLTQIDKDNIYVGFFASRNAKITVTDIKLTTSDPKTDPPAEEREKTYVTPSYKVVSATATGNDDYELIFLSNADGLLTVKGKNGNPIVTDKVVTADTYAKMNVKLDLGDNTFTVEFTPDKDFKFSEYEYLSSYETATFTHKVNHKFYDREVLHVAPNGFASGTGSKENPLDIYTAVKYVKAGQFIVLAEGTYKLNRTVTVPRGINGTADQMIYLIADPNGERPVFDFSKASAGMVFAGDYWYIRGFDVTNTADMQKGVQLSGDYCVLDQVNTYYNGNTGIQISRYLSSDKFEDWPSNNLVLNCTSYANADRGYEDADGFAAKLTIGEGNVFDGCIAYNNADDGWDLFAKPETGPIGQVIIRNCVTYGNGFLPDGTNAGNGNGFKLGGSSIQGNHILMNSVTYDNKAKGIDSNSGPNIIVYNSTTFNNGSYNVAFYTNDAVNTDFFAEGVISFRTENLENAAGENIKAKGTQDTNKIYGPSNYYWDQASKSSKNTEGRQVAEDWFVNLDTSSKLTRNNDGTINMNGLLVLTDKAPENVGAVVGGTPSWIISIPDEEVEPTPEPTPTPEVIVTPTPEPTPVPTVEEIAGERNQAAVSLESTVQEGKLNVAVNVSKDDILKMVEDSDTKDIIIPITSDTLISQLEQDDISDFEISVGLPKDLQKEDIDKINIPMPVDLLKKAAETKKDVKVTVNDEEGKPMYSWSFSGEDLANSDQDMDDVNLTIKVADAAEDENLSKLLGDNLDSEDNNKKAIVANFGHDGLLPAKATVRIYVGHIIDASVTDEVFVYHYNPVTDKLESLPFSSQYAVDQDGYITIDLVHCSDYVFLTEKPDSKLVVSLMNQIEINPDGGTIYLDGPKSTTKIEITLPDTLELVSSLDEEMTKNGKGAVKVNFTAMNDKVVRIDSEGNIEAVSSGRTYIITNVKLYSNKSKAILVRVVVK